MALAAACVAALLSVLAALLLTPEPAYTAPAGMAGWPRLLLYAAAGGVLALTAPRVCLSRAIHMCTPRRGAMLVTLGAAAGLMIALVNAARLRANIADPLGPALWIVSMLVLLAYTLFPLARRIGWSPLWPVLEKPGRYRWAPWLSLIVVMAIAAAVRLPGLGDIPQGINPDEGDRASTSVDLLHGLAPASWFDSGWFFINMIYFRVLAVSLSIFGPTVFGGRMLSALCGIAFVGVIAWIGWQQFSPRVGLLAAAFAAGLEMTIQHGRLITEAGPTALLWVISIGCFLEGVRTGRMWAWAVAGLTGGLSLYFYPSARLWSVGAVLTVLVILAFLRNPRVLPGVGIAALASIMAALPFLIHLSTHTDEFAGRYAQTAVLDPRNQERLAYLSPPEPLPALVALQAERTLGMFDRYPDGGGFLPINRAIFSPPLAQLALVGAFYLLVRGWRDVRLAVVSVWFWVSLSGVALTVETPDYLRSVGMLPSLCFILAILVLDLIDRLVVPLRATQWTKAAVPACAAVVLLTPEVVGYFATLRVMPSGWAPETHEGQVIAAMGLSGPVYSMEINEHMVTSGWVRLLSPDTERGRLPNPGRELPILSPVGASAVRPEFFAGDGQGFSVIMSPDPNQLPYIPLLEQLYPGSQPGDGGGDQRRSVAISAEALSDAEGVTLLDASGRAERVDHFGDVPGALPTPLKWRAGVRFPSSGTYTLVAPGATAVGVDGELVPANGTISSVAGVHFVEVQAAQPVSLSINGATLTPQQSYRLMDAPWGLLAHLGTPATTLLDSTVSMAFFDPELGFVSSPNVILWTGSLLAPRTGVYRMAFAAEDDMQLQVDGRPIDVVTVGPDAWRNVGVGSQVELSAGPHRVQVSLGITHGGRELARWNWVPPLDSGTVDTATPWSVVPPSVLRPS